MYELYNLCTCVRKCVLKAYKVMRMNAFLTSTVSLHRSSFCQDNLDESQIDAGFKSLFRQLAGAVRMKMMRDKQGFL